MCNFLELKPLLGSQGVICNFTQVNVVHLHHSQAGWYLIYLPQRDGRLSCL